MKGFLPFRPLLRLLLPLAILSISWQSGQSQTGCAAGIVMLPQSVFCPQDTVRLLAEGQATELEYQTKFLLTNTSGTLLREPKVDTAFVDLPFGDYRLYSYNYSLAHPPVAPPTVGERIFLVEPDPEGCFDISSGVSFSVRDTAPPVALCRTDTVLLYLDEQGGFDLSVEDFDLGSLDTCGGLDSIYLSQTLLDCDDLGYKTLQLIARDSAGHTDTCTFVVQVIDTLAPQLLCPDYTLYLDSLGFVNFAFELPDSSFDNCGIVEFFPEQTGFSCADGGKQQLALFARDAAGNADTCQVNLNVLDTLPPLVFCRDTQLFLDLGGQANLSPAMLDSNSYDNCALSDLSVSQTNFTCNDLGTQSVRLFALDIWNNQDSCTAQVTILDSLPPTPVCREAMIYLDGNGLAELSQEAIDNGSFDNCTSALAFELNKTTFNCTAVEGEMVTLYVFDTLGNVDSCTARVTALDTVPPSAICAQPTVFLDQQGLANLTPAALDGGSTDNCSQNGLFRNISRSGLDCADLGPVAVELIVSDNAGLSDTCSALVTVGDTLAPVARCRTATIYLDGNGMAQLSPQQVDNGSSDNCAVISLSVDQTAFTCEEVDTQSVRLLVEDESGNADECLATVLVRDTIVPTLACRDTIVYLNETGGADLTVAMVDMGSFDNCPTGLVLELDETAFGCLAQGVQTVVLSGTDASGNRDTCTARVSVRDTIPPQARCKDIVVYLDQGGKAELLTADLNAGSGDNCGAPASVLAERKRFVCQDAGKTIPVGLLVTDASGISDTCYAQVTVRDTTPPQAVCRETLSLYLPDSGLARLNPAMVLKDFVENCGILRTRKLSRDSFTCEELGENIVTLTIEDPQGLTAVCTTRLTVLDTLPPELVCQDVLLEVGANAQAILTPNLLLASGMENCGSLDCRLDRSIFNCADLGPNKVELTATDPSGNATTCTATVTIADSTRPQVRCQNATLTLNEAGSAVLSVEDIDAGSTDNCSLELRELSRTVFSCADLGENIVEYSVTDPDENTAICGAIVTVMDGLAPSFSCSGDQWFEVAQDGEADCEYVVPDNQLDPGELFDNCTIVRIEHDYLSPDSSSLLGAVFEVGTTRVRWEIEDASGLVSTCTFEITVEDQTAPEARCTDSLLVTLDPSGQIVLDSNLLDRGSSDNCSIASFELSRSVFDCSNVGFQTLSMTIRDEAGLQASCETVLGIRASEACPLPRIGNNNGPEIGDPCTCRGDGTFDEEIVVGPALKDQLWLVANTDLLDPNTLLPIPKGTPFREVAINADSSVYVLTGVHRSGEGYQMQVRSPLYSEVLSIRNTCYYPEPEILDLDGPICLFTDPIALKGEGGAGVSGSGSFKINGQEATVFDPMALGLGTHTVSYTFDAGSPAALADPLNTGCSVTVQKEVRVQETSPALACISFTNTSVNSNCEILITPEMILAGDFGCYDDYEVFLRDDFNRPVANPVPGSYAGQTLRVIVRHLPSNPPRSCSGQITLRDNSGPRLEDCPEDITDRYLCTDFDSIFNNPATIDPKSPLFTGVPEVVDNCTATELTFQDVLQPGDDCDGPFSRVIKRTFRAEDVFGNTTICSQFIYFYRPEEIFFPKDTLIAVDCNQAPPAIDENGNVSPSISGYPFALNAYGDRVDIADNTSICHWISNYTDSRLPRCDNRYRLRRIWEAIDFCGNVVLRDTQTIDFGDFEAPLLSCPQLDLNGNGIPDGELVYSVNAFSCTADVPIPDPEIEDCSEVSIQKEIYTFNFRFNPETGGFDEVFEPLQVVIQNGVAREVPLGNHFFVYTVTDDCGLTTRDTCPFEVADLVIPTVLCDDDLSVSIGTGGTGQISAGDIDEGSRDNCDDNFLRLQVRRLIPGACSSSGQAEYSEYGNFVSFNCCDVDRLITVEIQAEDQSGNKNTCITRVRVDDRLAPACQAPPNVAVDCNDLPSDFDPQDTDYLQASFGTPTVQDNCEGSWEELPPLVQLDDCGFGSLTRRFQGVDIHDNVSSASCQQTITIRPVFDYSIKFPKDAVASCGTQMADTLELFSEGCDQLLVNVEDRLIQFSGQQCQFIERTYTILNECEYDGFSPAVVLGRDLDCDGDAGEEDLWLIVDEDGVVYLDRDPDPTNNNPAAGERGTTCNGQSNPAGYWRGSLQTNTLSSIGRWEYTQLIEVVDDERPRITPLAIEAFCTEGASCEGPVRVPFQITEECTPNDLQIRVFEDSDGNGSGDLELPKEVLSGTYPEFFISGRYGLSSRQFFVEVSDGCGNTSVAVLPFEVVDCKASTVNCITELTVVLGPAQDSTDIDQDGVEDLAVGFVTAESFVKGNLPADCSGPVEVSIVRQGEPGRPGQDTLYLTCADEGFVPVDIYFWDAAYNPEAVQPDGSLGGPNYELCSVVLDVQSSGRSCDPLPKGTIEGFVFNEEGQDIQNVQVLLSGENTDNMVFTEFDGFYRFDNLEEGGDYSVTPGYDGDYLNGVTTFDLILIRKHILGRKLLETPYRMIAADVNGSGSVTTLDMILIQKLILGRESAFPLPSWRFIIDAHSFTNPNNPWEESFPEVFSLNNLDGTFFEANFIGLKVGDVNNSSQTNLGGAGQERAFSNPAGILTEDVDMRKGEVYELRFLLEEPASLEGYQFALEYDPYGLEILDWTPVTATEDQLHHLPEQHQLRTNWYRVDERAPVGTLFRLRVRARSGGRVLDFLNISSRGIPAEAYDVNGRLRGVCLKASNALSSMEESRFRLLPNIPNPFREATRIRFELPESGPTLLRIYQADGNLIFEQSYTLEKGAHEINIPAYHLPAGVLFYTLTSGEHQASRKMVKLE